MARTINTLYWLADMNGYWVLSHAGYDIEAFTSEAEARATYDRLVAAEQQKKQDCPFNRDRSR